MGRRKKEPESDWEVVPNLPADIPKPVNRSYTEEGRRNQLINEAYDLVEKRLVEGTATSQETVFFLRLGAEQTKLEEEKLKAEVELKKAQAEALHKNGSSDELYQRVLSALSTYKGSEEPI
jgi:hypothetical protein